MFIRDDKNKIPIEQICRKLNIEKEMLNELDVEMDDNENVFVRQRIFSTTWYHVCIFEKYVEKFRSLLYDDNFYEQWRKIIFSYEENKKEEEYQKNVRHFLDYACTTFLGENSFTSKEASEKCRFMCGYERMEII
jgi:hypothetical protein